MELLEKNLNGKIFHSDLEKAAHIAVFQSFTQCTIIVCCKFHLGRSWFRRLQKNKFIKKYAKNNYEIGIWVEILFRYTLFKPK